MITIDLMGGLGNQLFQIFTTIAYAKKHGIPYQFFYSKQVPVNRDTYWDNFLIKLKPYTARVALQVPIYPEKGHHYQEIPKINKDFKLFGYFQSYKYFDDQYKEITELIGLRDLQESLKNENSEYFTNPTISLHFRMGDYKNLQDFHPIMKFSYYQKALEKILENTEGDFDVLYFCEEEDNLLVEKIVNILKAKSSGRLEFKKVSDSLYDWEQMLMMSLCDHNIIANSSFSLWGAYFNNNQGIVCYPSIWFGPKLADKDTQDLFKESWFKI